MSIKLTLGICVGIAKTNSGLCLSKKYINTHSKLKWKCSKGHIWMASLHNVKNHNHWCPKCATKRTADFHRLDGIKEATEIANKNGGECLTTEYINNHTKMKWKCPKGHVWGARLNNVKNQKQWCPKCGTENATKKLMLDGIAIAFKIAIKNKGKFLSKEYKHNKQKLKWECMNGHQWTATLNNLMRKDCWCPECALLKTQKKLTKIIKMIFPEYSVFSNYKAFNWLKTGNKGGKQELDIFIPEIKLAIEYDGEQHFKPVCFGGISEKQAKENFKRSIKLDKLKNRKIAQHQDDVKYFIRFNYKEDLTEDYIRNKITRCGVKNITGPFI